MTKSEIIMDNIGETRFFIKDFTILKGNIIGLSFIPDSEDDEIDSIRIKTDDETEYCIGSDDSHLTEISVLTVLRHRVDKMILRLEKVKKDVYKKLNLEDELSEDFNISDIESLIFDVESRMIAGGSGKSTLLGNLIVNSTFSNNLAEFINNL